MYLHFTKYYIHHCEFFGIDDILLGKKVDVKRSIKKADEAAKEFEKNKEALAVLRDADAKDSEFVKEDIRFLSDFNAWNIDNHKTREREEYKDRAHLELYRIVLNKEF